MTVVRYDLNEGYASCGSMQVDHYGEYVKWEDYEDLLKQLTEATGELTRVTLQLNMALRENAGLRERLVEGERELDNSPVVVWQD